MAKPRTLAIMHGSSFAGDGAQALQDLDAALRDVFGRDGATLDRRAKLGPDAYVFGSATGAYQPDLQTAWETLRLLAHAIEPRPTSEGRGVEPRAAAANRSPLARPQARQIPDCHPHCESQRCRGAIHGVARSVEVGFRRELIASQPRIEPTARQVPTNAVDPAALPHRDFAIWK